MKSVSQFIRVLFSAGLMSVFLFYAAFAGTDANWEAMNTGGIAGTDGIIYTQLYHQGKLYIGGDFTTVGTMSAYGIAVWDGNQWTALGKGVSPHHGIFNDGTPSTYDGVVKTIAIDTFGNVYAGGAFDSAGGVRVNNIAQWDGTKWNAVGPGTNWEVRCLSIDKNNNVYMGGSFSMVGPDSSGFIEKWDGKKWSTIGKGNYGGEVALMQFDKQGNLYMGGTWPYQNYFVMKWDGAALDTVWQGYQYWTLKTMAIDSAGSIYLGGFNYTNGTGWIIKQEGSSWTIFDTLKYVVASSVNALAFDRDGVLFVGGNFRIIGKTAASNIARWDGAKWCLLEESAVGIKPNLFEAGTDGAIYSLEFGDKNELFVAGAFSRTTYLTTGNIAVWDGQKFEALTRGNTSGDRIDAMAADNRGNLYVAGLFPTIGGVAASNFAKWDGSKWSPFDFSPRGYIGALVVDKNRNLYAAGDFDTIGNLVAHRVAKWDGNVWSPLGAGLKGSVYSLVMDNNQMLYAGGNISSDSQNVARWNGVAWEPLPGKLPAIYALAIDNLGVLYAGGADKYLRRWNGAKWDTAFGTTDHKYIYAIAIDSTNNIYIGGYAGGREDTIAAFSKWDGVRWNPILKGDGEYPVNIETFDCDNKGNVFVKRTYFNENYVQLGSIEKWDGKTWTQLGTGIRNNLSSPSINTTLLKDSLLYIGGSFLWAGDKISPMVARINVYNFSVAKVITHKPAVLNSTRFRIAQSVLEISDIHPNDRIVLFYLNGRCVRKAVGVSKIDLRGIAEGLLYVRVLSEGKEVRTGMVMR